MQTFLPYPDFRKSAEALDYKRLGRQRTECRQLLRAITSPRTAGWASHPAAIMWRQAPNALALYTAVIDDEWIKRGYKHTMERFALDIAAQMPWWFGDKRFHLTHRRNLIRKNPEYYAHFKVEPLEGYWWPGEFSGWEFIEP